MRRAVIIIAVSVAIHLLLWRVFTHFGEHSHRDRRLRAPTTLRVKIKPAMPPRRIIEAQQRQTAPPRNPRYLGHTDHQAKVETKAAPRRQQRRVAASTSSAAKSTNAIRSIQKSAIVGQQKIAIAPRNNEITPKLSYAQFLQQSQQNLYTQSFQDVIDADLPAGEVIDISTGEYRYIGYFSNLRKAIEMVWNYPSQAAQRGQQGVVRLRFAIAADGTASQIKVTQSSGHRLLDVAIVDAVRLASPFSPLPQGFKRKHLLITGAFHYILRGI